jgi:hypothetical protein
MLGLAIKLGDLGQVLTTLHRVAKATVGSLNSGWEGESCKQQGNQSEQRDKGEHSPFHGLNSFPSTRERQRESEFPLSSIIHDIYRFGKSQYD